MSGVFDRFKAYNMKSATIQDSTLKARYTTREEWLSQNEYNLSRLWSAMLSYLKHTNSFLLDRCDYVTFSDFVATHSTHFESDTS